MIDLDSAKTVEITVDSTGKLWVNVDGVCQLRIGSCDVVTVDDPARGRNVVKQIEPKAWWNDGILMVDANLPEDKRWKLAVEAMVEVVTASMKGVNICPKRVVKCETPLACSDDCMYDNDPIHSNRL